MQWEGKGKSIQKYALNNLTRNLLKIGKLNKLQIYLTSTKILNKMCGSHHYN